MGEINWNLLGGGVDTGTQVQQGFATGMALVKQIQTKNALRAYLANPDDAGAYNALAFYDPQAAASIQQRQLLQRKIALDEQDRARTAQIGTLLASGDSATAKRAALGAGDLELVKQIDSLDDATRKREHDRYQNAAPFAYDALQIKDPAQRKAYIESVKPQLVAGGWTEDQIDGFDPTDANLGGIVRAAQTLAERMGQDEVVYREVGPGARLVPFDKRGRPLTGDSGGVAPTVTTTPAPAEAAGAVSQVLSAGGLPSQVVAGFLGNFDIEGGYSGGQGDGGKSAGIAQWNGARRDNFKRIIGKDAAQATPEEAAKFVLWEMQNPHSAGLTIDQRDAILAAQTPAEAASLIDKYFERSSGKDRDKRIAAAAKYGGAADDKATVLAQAQAAIAAGADPDAVRARAKAMGVSL